MRKNDFCRSRLLTRQIAESRNRLYRVALAWCGDEMLADDLAQESVADGITNVKQLRDETRLFAWLYSILNNNWRRHLRRSKSHDELDDEIPCESAEPIGHCHEMEVVMRVRNAVARLPIQQRQVVSLVDLEELPYCDVAEILDIPIGTVMSRLHRARKNLLAKLESPAAEIGGERPQIHIVK